MALDDLPRLALIPAGEFLMGSADGEEDERPVHAVHVDDFLIGIQPVTNAEYALFVRDTGHRAPSIYEIPLVVGVGGIERQRVFRQTAAPYEWVKSEPSPDRLHHPVTLVRYDDASAYCAWLAAVTGRAFRLPTEAEWEKAARGGVESKRYPWGDEIGPRNANFLADPDARSSSGTTKCQTYPPNDFGLFDMAGHVWEWVQDWYSPAYYAASSARNPAGPPRGQLRVLRGGGWLASDARMLACSHRHKVPPDTYSYGIGFRVACSPPATAPNLQ
jgi:formylglycine-generating enzyme required for sulfatase activity